MAEIINIKNEAGEVQYPVTKPECVIDENGKSVLTLIQENGTELRQEIDELSTETETIRTEIESQNELIEDLQNTKIDKEADDYYPQLAVGLADNLSGVDVVDSEVNFRRSGGGAISDGVARIEAIKGNSVVWNQLMENGDFSQGKRYWGIFSNNSFVVEDGVATITLESMPTSGAYAYLNYSKNTNYIVGHKYYVSAEGNIPRQTTLEIQSSKLSFLTPSVVTPIINTWTRVAAIGEGIKEELMSFAFFARQTIGDWEVGDQYKVRNYQIIDLTKMFGAGNEPTTIEDFYARIPMGVDLNAYNEGEVIHMDVQSIESQGVNVWDEEWEVGTYNLTTGEKSQGSGYIRSTNLSKCLPSEKYYIKTTKALYILWYDNNRNYISNIWASNSIIQAPSNAAYLAFRSVNGEDLTTYNHDICINLSDTAINGKYYPYIKRVEDLSIIRKYFPQGMKSAGSAHDEIRYNKASGKWEKVVRIGEVDLGLLNWEYATATSIFYARESYFFANQSLLSAKYGNKNGQNEDKNMYAVGGSVRILDSAYTDAAFFKAAMQGVILYYKLAEPIVTELDEADQFKDLDYQVWNDGTEKAIAEGKSSALAADITYGFNAIGKIKELESLVAALRAKVGI